MLTPEQIASVRTAAGYGPLPQGGTLPAPSLVTKLGLDNPNPGYFSRVGTDISNTVKEASDNLINTPHTANPLVPIQKGLQTAGTVAKGVIAPIAEAPVIKQIGEATNSIGKSISDWAMKNPTYSAFFGKLSNIIDQHPNAAKDVGALTNLGNLFLMGEATPKAIETGVEKVGAVGSGTKSIATGATKFGVSQLTGLSPSTLAEVVRSPESFTKEAQASISRPAVADTVSGAIEARTRALSDTGHEYSGIRVQTKPVKVSPTYLDDLIKSTTGLSISKEGVLTPTGSSSIRLPSDVNALQTKLYDIWKPEFAKGNLTPAQFLNFREDLARMAYNDSGIGKSTPLAHLADTMRAKSNTALRAKIPGLESLDRNFAPQIQELKDLSRGLVDKNGHLSDAAINRIANATGKGKDPFLARIETLSPGITSKIKILKAVEDIQSSRENKPGTYIRAGAAMGAVASLNPYIIVAVILSMPEVAIPMLRRIGYTSQFISKTLNTLGIKITPKEVDAIKPPENPLGGATGQEGGSPPSPLPDGGSTPPAEISPQEGPSQTQGIQGRPQTETNRNIPSAESSMGAMKSQVPPKDVGGVPSTPSSSPVGQEAVDTLLTSKNGEVKNALSNPEIGHIDLMWGTTEGEGGGLAKIAKEHPEAVDNLDYILKNAKVVGGREGRIYLETNDGYRAVVRTDFNEEPKQWLLTAYMKDGQGGGSRTPSESFQTTHDTGSLHPGTDNIASQSDVVNTLRGTKGLTADDIMKTYPNIKLTRDVPATDIHGNKVQIPEGEKLTPYELKGNKILLQDGETYIVSKNQFENIKGNSVGGEAKPFAPELAQTEETMKGAGGWKGDEYVADGKTVANLVKNEDGTWSYQSDLSEGSDTFKTKEQAREAVVEEITDPYAETGTKFSSYQLPGGKNYKEILIKAPETVASRVGGKGYDENGMYAEDFKSSHWDEPNVLAHLRLNERTYKGKKVDFMEELQSDWARESRGKGFVPNNPLLKDWTTLAVKRALLDAVDTKADYFSWINGEQTSARYNLATHLKSADWETSTHGSKWINLNPQEGGTRRFLLKADGTIGSAGGGVPEGWIGQKLDQVLGKGLADKIMAEEKGTLSGEGLKFGGEWANNLYDKQVPNIVKDLTGGKIETIDMGLPIARQEESDISSKAKTTTQQAIRLTPEIKARILGKAPKIKTSGKQFGK